MKRSFSVTLLLSVAIVCGCARWRTVPPQATDDCPLVAAPGGIISDSVPLDRLAGRTRMVLIDTLNSWVAPDSLSFELQVPDSAFRAMFIDEFRRITKFSSTPKLPLLVEYRSGSSFVTADHRKISIEGCFPFIRCYDESSSVFRFKSYGVDYVRGTWSNSMTGIGVLINPNTGRRVDRAAGIFCLVPV